ncbi:N-acetylmuramoyl-L-alanine amidase [Bathymodiolus thermophilus thioautotrophic gill symbiont]|uniref:1,6-anhydro-N-acetylmuramyl-L-alanine amidase AmpD n=2 Tax=Bathymodiolus thermophilus thioautotrophic gill symbiont TaxID=2360 RepID=A0A1J5UE49_9GAMM|nr:N-acetylmuramoyl-L-alanine amidase [Bathymodiolus thermophilus thioautotrophic gill symbiont]
MLKKMTFKQTPSPNFSKRTAKIDMVVIHNISLPPNKFGGSYIEDFFQNQLDPTAHPYFATIEHLKVSSHLLIKRNGAVVQFVQFADKAWHAGVSHYRGRDNCNDFSIGIELEGADDIAYTVMQYQQLNKILADLCEQYPIKYIVGHNDIAPDRKTDPGRAFDWSKINEHRQISKKD